MSRWNSAANFGSKWRAPTARRGCTVPPCFCFSSRAKLRIGPILLATSLAALITAGSALAASRLTRNFTGSLPLGIYWLRPGLSIERGEIVDLAIPPAARPLVGRYLPPRFRLLKRVVALEGDVVCFRGGRYRVNDAEISTIAPVDSVGRPLTAFPFCGPVPSGMAFVATVAPSSLDSRYFGPVPVDALTVARPLWTS